VPPEQPLTERQITSAASGHMLTHAAVWSADSRWLVYDTRQSLDGAVFDGTCIERVEIETGRIERLYTSRGGAGCGVATTCPVDDRVVLIHGPEHPTADWQYAACHRRGVVVRTTTPDGGENLDACDLTPPFTSGALRGGTHLHLFSPDGRFVSFTYEDAILDASQATTTLQAVARNLRGIGLTICDEPVRVPRTHPRNHDGSGFSVLLTRLHDAPAPGSDQIMRACEEAWVGTNGYLRSDGSRQQHALAFQGEVVTARKQTIREVFVLDLPDRTADLHEEADGPLAGTPTTRPAPPRGVRQRRLTDTSGLAYPGLSGPRHWLRSSPDGSRIGFLARDDRGIVQIFTVSPNARPTADGTDAIRQVTNDGWDVSSCFSWSPCGRRIGYVADGSVFEVDVETGSSARLTKVHPTASPPRPEACVHSPDGRWLAFLRTVILPDPQVGHERSFNQIFVVSTTG
jgi:hypothetical protein